MNGGARAWSLGAKLWNFTVVMAIFVVVGPAVAALAFVGLLVAWLSQVGAEDAAPFIAMASLFGVMLGYIGALAPATVAGALFGLWQSLVGRVRWHGAAIAGLALGLASAALSDMFETAPGEKSLLPVLLLTSLAATMACWLLARSFVTAGERP